MMRLPPLAAAAAAIMLTAAPLSGSRVTSSSSASFQDDFLRMGRAFPNPTDKITDHTFETMYGLLLWPRRYSVTKLLEIGLGFALAGRAIGAGALLWRKVCPRAEIYVAERNKQLLSRFAPEAAEHHIQLLQGNQGNRTELARWVAQTGGGLDVIIDDGGHTSELILISFEELWPALAPNGLYYIEDVQVTRSHGGPPFLADVLAAWNEQLAISRDGSRREPPRAGPRRGGLNGNQSEPSNARALVLAERHPLPCGVEFILCQRQACVVGKQKEAYRCPRTPVRVGALGAWSGTHRGPRGRSNRRHRGARRRRGAARPS